MAEGFWNQNTTIIEDISAYLIAMTESMTYIIRPDRFLARITVDSGITTGQVLTLATSDGVTFLNTVSVKNDSSSYTVTVTDGSTSYLLPPLTEMPFFIDSGDLKTSPYSVKNADEDIEGTKTFKSTPILEDGLALSSGRRFAESKLLNSVNVPSQGWYEIAKIESDFTQPYNADFVVSAFASFVEETVSFSVAGAVSISNPIVNIKYTNRGCWSPDQQRITGVRLAYAPYGISGGAKVEVMLNPYAANNTWTLRVAINNNETNLSSVNDRNVFTCYDTPILSTGYTPDETTLATYLEAGTVFDRTGSTYTSQHAGITATRDQTSVIGFSLQWDDIPKQNATSMTFLYTSLALYSGSTLIYTFDGSEVFGTPYVKGKEVICRVTVDATLAASVNLTVVTQNFKATLS